MDKSRAEIQRAYRERKKIKAGSLKKESVRQKVLKENSWSDTIQTITKTRNEQTALRKTLTERWQEK